MFAIPVATLSRVVEASSQLAAAIASRPTAWIGYRIVPEAIEFWTRGAHRLHERVRYERTGTGWRRRLLQP